MKRRTCALILTMSMVCSLVVPSFAQEGTRAKEEKEMVYLGVQGYGTVTKDQKEQFQHRFYVEGGEGTYTIQPDASAFRVQNKLQEGYIYEVTVENGVVQDATIQAGDAAGALTAVDMANHTLSVDGKNFTCKDDVAVYNITSQVGGSSVKTLTQDDLKVGDTVRVFLDDQNQVERIYVTFVAKDYTAPVSGVAGKRTLKNFLATALEPVGTSLYIYGGTWDWQDVGSSNQATTIGLSQSWVDFFQSQTADYTYKNEGDHSKSYYPHEAWNQYYYAGIDCSGYVGWSVYNVMNTVNGQKGYVQSATGMAKNFAETEGWGTWTQTIQKETFKPGDIFSMNGHVWICLGVCEDGSLVIMHSTPSDSVNGQPGGGVQINGVGDNENCQAVQLARHYMSKYYPQWYNRYQKVYKNYADYTTFTGDKAGKFSWNIGTSGTLTDPDGYLKMSADEILKDLFDERSSGGGGGTTETVKYTINATSNAGGSISPSGTVSVNKGDSKTFTMKADAGYHIADVTVNGKSVGAVSTYTFKNVQEKQSIQVTFEKDAPEAPSFQDVPKDAWYYDGVTKACEMGIMSGVSANRFAPDENVTRSMVGQILYAQEGKPAVSGGNVGVDVPQDAWFASSMKWAKETGLISGYPDGRMGPNDSVTRQQLALMLYNYARNEGMDTSKKGDLSGYTDLSKVAPWAKEAMEWAVGSGLISGRGGNALAPEGSATRAEAALIMTQLLGK